MRIDHIALILFGLIAGAANAVAQSDMQISQYWSVPGYYNPAAIALDKNLTVAALSRLQWVGITNAPTSFMLLAETPFKLLKKTHSVGLIALNDKAGLFSNLNFGLQYAYHAKLWDGELSLGVRAGVINQTFDGSKVDIPSTPDHDPADDAIPRTSVSAMGFDAAFGVYYQHKYFYTGLSSTHLTQPVLELTDRSYSQFDRVYYFTGGSNIALKNSLYELQPSFLLKSDFRSTQVDLTVRLIYNKMFWGGISYRLQDAVVLLLGAHIGAVRVGYAYDISTSPLGKVSSGSHELFAAYSLKIDLDNKTKNKHKSIRLL